MGRTRSRSDVRRVVASGPLYQAMTEETLSETFGLSLQLDYRDGRYAARAR